ncbi:MAG: ATP-binding protein [Actinomycetota bacterium]|nr:ATP-binding protein [Actinomycetota bacterium]
MTDQQTADPAGAATPPPGFEAVDVPLPQDLTAPAVARGAVRRLLDRWNLHGVLEPVLLAVSELVTNALRHGRPPVALRLERSGGGVTVDVHDGSMDLPGSATEAAESAESGRGLGIVEAMASDTGVKSCPDDGKVIWARFDPDRAPDGRS